MSLLPGMDYRVYVLTLPSVVYFCCVVDLRMKLEQLLCSLKASDEVSTRNGKMLMACDRLCSVTLGAITEVSTRRYSIHQRHALAVSILVPTTVRTSGGKSSAVVASIAADLGPELQKVSTASYDSCFVLDTWSEVE